MARYWVSVHKRAWRDAGKSVGLESRERVVLLLLIQTLIGLALWFALGNSALQSTIWGRVATAGIPFLLLPAIYLWKLLGTPGRMSAEAEAVIAALQADKLDLQVVEHLIGYRPPDFVLSGDPLALIVKVRNPGLPTIVTNWKLCVLNAEGHFVGKMRVGAAAFDVYRRVGRSDIRLDISREPLSCGAEATAILLIFSEDIDQRFVSGRQSFRIECEDVKRRRSSVDYMAVF